MPHEIGRQPVQRVELPPAQCSQHTRQAASGIPGFEIRVLLDQRTMPRFLFSLTLDNLHKLSDDALSANADLEQLRKALNKRGDNTA